MAERPRRRRGHAAATARILTAGLSSAAAFGMVAGMAVAGATDNQPEAPPPTPPAAVAPGVPAEGVVVVRRYLRPGSVPLLAQAPARPAPAAAPRAPATPPVTRTRGS